MEAEEGSGQKQACDYQPSYSEETRFAVVVSLARKGWPSRSWGLFNNTTRRRLHGQAIPQTQGTFLEGLQCASQQGNTPNVSGLTVMSPTLEESFSAHSAEVDRDSGLPPPTDRDNVLPHKN